MSKRLNSSLMIAASFVLVIGFQNCAKTNFSSAPNSVSLKTQDMVSTLTNENINGDGNPELPPAPTVAADAPTDGVPPVAVVPTADLPHGQSPGVVPAKGPSANVNSGDGAPTSSSIASGAVECDLKAPNTKIILSKTLEGASNASCSRVCMSEHACLQLINSYASARSCTLAAGPAQSSASGQCTAIFPGSKGTCKHAKILTDSEVLTLLGALAAAP